ncbi:MAG: RNA polymerase sigma factor [Myxococcales bacterium]|nr:RNA polymerase sigma factor [Myxococcales bacterium]
MSLPASTRAPTRAFRRIFQQNYAYVGAVLARLGVERGSVDDALQEVFLTAYRRRDSFDGERPLKPWLAGIARRVAFRHRRGRMRARRKLDAFTRWHVDARLDPARDEGMHRQLVARRFLDGFIATLDPPRRDVFVLAELEGLRGREIAERLGIKVDTAYTRLRAARLQLRRALAELEPPPAPRAQVQRAWVVLLPQLELPGGATPATATAATGTTASRWGLAALGRVELAAAAVIGALVFHEPIPAPIDAAAATARAAPPDDDMSIQTSIEFRALDDEPPIAPPRAEPVAPPRAEPPRPSSRGARVVTRRRAARDARNSRRGS